MRSMFRSSFDVSKEEETTDMVTDQITETGSLSKAGGSWRSRMDIGESIIDVKKALAREMIGNAVTKQQQFDVNYPPKLMGPKLHLPSANKLRKISAKF